MNSSRSQTVDKAALGYESQSPKNVEAIMEVRAYRQVIMRDGVPFSLNIPDRLITRDIITATEFDTVMRTGLEQAKSDDSISVDEAFNQLKTRFNAYMDKYEVKVTKQALEQMRAIMELSALPQRYSLIDEEPWRSEGIRKPVVKNFLIYYWIDNECNKVQVTAVIYSKRDQIEQLKNMDLN